MLPILEQKFINYTSFLCFSGLKNCMKSARLTLSWKLIAFLISTFEF